MKIKVVLWQIRKNCHIKIYSVNSVIIQSMTGNFNNSIFSPRGTSFGKKLIENERIWTCHFVSIFCPNAVDSQVDGRKHTYLLSCSLKSTSNNIASGRFSFGAGNSYNYHVPGGISVEKIGQNPSKIVVKYTNRAIKSDSIFDKMEHTNWF